MTAARSFKLATLDAIKAERDTYGTVAFDFDTEHPDGSVTTRTCVAHFPGDGALMLLASSSGADAEMADSLSAVFALFEQTFSTADYKFIRSKIRSQELPARIALEMIGDMTEAWSGFPTQPSSDSPVSPPSTGTRSTGRAPSKASTQRRSQ